jgi:hypothetical protein
MDNIWAFVIFLKRYGLILITMRKSLPWDPIFIIWTKHPDEDLRRGEILREWNGLDHRYLPLGFLKTTQQEFKERAFGKIALPKSKLPWLTNNYSRREIYTSRAFSWSQRSIKYK